MNKEIINDLVLRKILIDKSLLRISDNFKKLPRYVVEYLISNFVDKNNKQQGIERINKIINENHIESDKKEWVKNKIKINGKYNLIGDLKCSYDQYSNEYIAHTTVLSGNKVRVSKSVIDQFGDVLLSGGCFGNCLIEFVNPGLMSKKQDPYHLTSFIPFKITKITIQEWLKIREKFSLDEWINLIINTLGFNPEKLSENEKWLYLFRLIPLVESNINFIELSSPETGKTYFYRSISNNSLILSGSDITVASLFYNKVSKRAGVLGNKDCVIFDEIVTANWNNKKDLQNILKDYLENGKFNRDNVEISSDCSIVFLGNIVCDRGNKKPLDIYKHLLDPLPEIIKNDTAFLDRINGFIPGWEAPQISSSNFSEDYGFSSDYFSEILHKLRTVSFSELIKSKIDFQDTSFRNERSVIKITSGLIKVLFPSGRINNDELEILVEKSVELRERVLQQLHVINPNEFNGEIKWQLKN